MRRRTLTMLVAITATVGLAACGSDDAAPPAPDSQGATSGAGSTSAKPSAERVLTGTLPLLNGDDQDLAEYEGKVVMVVNTASQCGYTPQFETLEALYDEHRDDGLVILGFPADDVAGQEPREDAAIAEFCEVNFGVSFPMFAKSNVVEEPVNPLFQRLAAAAGGPTWNFNKYLVDRDGNVVERYDAGTAPDDPELNSRIDELL